jgi:hypothetical protein
MWVFRALVHFAFRIAIAVLIAIAIAEIRAVVTGGDTVSTFRIILLILGGLYLLLGAGGSGSAASHRVNWSLVTPGRGGVIVRGFRPRADEPQLSAGAVLIGSGIVLLVLGTVV